MNNHSSLFVFLSAVLFALGGLFFKMATWSSMSISSARSIIALAVVLIFSISIKHKFTINKTVIFASISMACTNLLFAYANKLTTAGNVIVLEFTMPVFVILIMTFIYKKKPTKLEISTCAAVFVGIVLFFIDSLSAGNSFGNLLSLISGVTYAGYFIFNSREDSDPLTSIILSYSFTSLLGLPSLLQENIMVTPASSLLAIIGLGVLQQGAAQIFLSLGIKGTPPVTASLISGVEPILNPILVAVFANEMITPLSFLGAAIVIITIIYYNYSISIKNKRKKKKLA